jgi:hypothetical protein
MCINNLNVQNYGALTLITDTGRLQVQNMYLKNQMDENTSGGLTLNCNDVAPSNLTLVANGSGSSLDILLQGQASWHGITLNMNCGGSVCFEVAAETMGSVTCLSVVDCSGVSHGRLSSGKLVNAGNFTVDTFAAPDGCDYEDVTEPAGTPTWLVTFPAGGGNTFTVINTGILDMPIPY